MKKSLNFILFFLTCIPVILLAQNDSFTFERLSVKNGLSHNNIYSIIQDKEGYIWIGTQDGLNKYDGYKFTIYRHDPSNLNSLSSNNFGKMYQDTSGIIWLGTYGGGLDRFDPLTQNFQHYKHSETNKNTISSDRIQFIHEDKFGLFWIGTSGGGLNMFDRKTGSFVHFMPDENKKGSFSHNRAKAIAEDKNGNLWIGTGNGLNLLDRKTGYFKKYFHDSNNPNSLSHNHIQSIIIDHNGIIWLGGRGGGLNRFDPGKEEFTCFKNNPDNPNSLNDNSVENIFEDSENNLWIGTYSGGLNLFDREKNIFYHFVYNPNNPNSISHNRIEYIFEDKSKVLWIGTRGGGISKLDLKKKKFHFFTYLAQNQGELPHPSVYAINGDSIGNLWMGTDGGGFIKYNLHNKLNILFSSKSNKNKIPKDRIWSILQDKDGVIWAGTYNSGLIRLIKDKDNKYQISVFTNNPNNKHSLSGKQVNVVYEDKEGRIWVGTKRGLYLLVSSKYDSELMFKSFTHNTDNPNSISDNYVSCILQDSYGYLWVGTYISGLNQLDIETGSFTHYNYSPNDSTSISSNRIQSVFEDSFQNLWVGTEGAGLNKFDRKKQNFIRIKQNIEIYSNVIMAILEDNNNNLWISSSGGINKFDLKTETFIKKYDITDGILSNGFNRNACYKDKNNTLYFGSISGVTYFNPTDIKNNPFPPLVLITDFKIFNTSLKKLDPLRNKILKEQNRVDLDYGENVINIEFAAADYSAVYKNKFKYKLDGFEKQWLSLGNQHIVTYTNLYPGKYTFRVIASNNDDVWNNTGNHILIVVHPPFYLKKGFVISVILSFLALLYIGIKLRIKKYDRDKRILETKVEERTHEINKQKEALKKANLEITENARLKEMFLANTSHEIRTPLNVIVGFTNLLTNTKLNDKQKTYLQNIKNYSKSLLVLINDILDFSKIEAGKLSLEKIRFEFRNTIKTILTPLTDKAKKKNLSLEYHISKQIPAHFIGDPFRLDQILNNLIENSIKFTQNGDNINLDINILKQEKNNFTLEFKVSDTGIGITPDKFEKIFESFSQARSDTSRKYGGTGLGLTIVKRLVELHNGTITVESKPGKGAMFTFSLKYKRSQIQEENQEISNTRNNKTTLTKELRILIVEDNIANQTLVVDTIHMFNDKINIDVADNGVIAIQKLNNTHYDLIIMDVQMPEMNGYDATQYIRTNYNNYKKNIPILGMSAHAMNKEKEKCLELGMNDYITKPFNPNVLFSKILKLTGQIQKSTKKESNFVPETLIVKDKYNIINLEFLTKTYNGNFDKVKNILKIYLQNIPEQITEFSNDFNETNWNKLKTSAHTLKTSFKYLGVEQLHKLFKTIEIESSSGTLSIATKKLIGSINNLWRSAKQEIQDFLDSDS